MSQDNRQTKDEPERKTLVIAEEMYNLARSKYYTPITDRIEAAEAFAILVQPILSKEEAE